MVKLSSRCFGDAGQVLVALHGFMGSSNDWKILEQLSCRVLAFDLPGHGGSTGLPEESYGFLETAELIAAQVEEVGTPVNLLGYSMGGRLSLWLALSRPELFQQVIIEAGTPGLKTDTQREARSVHDQKLAKKLMAEGMAVFLQEWYRQPLFASLAARKDLLERLVQGRLGNDPQELAKALVGAGTGNHPGHWPLLKDLNVPVTVLYGELDRKYRLVAEEMAGLSPMVRAVMVPGAGHNTHLENPKGFLAAVRPLLTERSCRDE